MQPRHEIPVVPDIGVEVIESDNLAIFGGLVKPCLDYGLDSYLDLGNILVAACLGQLSLYDFHTFEQVFD